MRKFAWLCLMVNLGLVAWVGESSACWWRRQAGWRYSPAPAFAAPVVHTQPAPVAWPVLASPQAPSAAASPRTAAASPAPVKTFIFQGKTYQAVPTNERGESEEMELRRLAPFVASRRAGDGEHFAGSARKSAKTSFADAAEESFASPGALLDAILKGAALGENDREMRGKLNASSPRVSDELRNVTVTAFLYATKKEADNDFHLLIGDNPDGGDGRFMTVEVSGLPNPDNADTPRFQKVRDQYKAFFAATGQELPGDRYVRFPRPIPVTVTGSIFFDVDHRIGEVRSGTIVPETVWEVHPLSDVVFGTTGGQ